MSLIDPASELTCRLSPEGRILHVSSSSREVLGVHPEQLVGRHVTELMHPNDMAALLEHSRRRSRSPVTR